MMVMMIIKLYPSFFLIFWKYKNNIPWITVGSLRVYTQRDPVLFFTCFYIDSSCFYIFFRYKNYFKHDPILIFILNL